MTMWNGRFTKELDSKINDFNSSISFDHVMYQEDILGSMAHAKMLGETGIIDKTEAEAIVEGLQGILEDIQSLPSALGIQASACIQPAAGMTRWPWILKCI